MHRASCDITDLDRQADILTVFIPPYPPVEARVKYPSHVRGLAEKKVGVPQSTFSKLTNKRYCNNDALNEMNRLRNLSSDS
ncbi:hypothetical protein TNCV_4290541 [Trichonephila clavipes]|nr:hypothetical protein TNCV_4290541 [Trichonephila clavipes]